MLHNTCCCVHCSHTSLADFTSHSLPLAFGVTTNSSGYLWVKCHHHLAADHNCLPSARWSGGDISGHHTWLHQVGDVWWTALLQCSRRGNRWTCCIHSIHSTLPTLTTSVPEQHVSRCLANLQKYLYREQRMPETRRWRCCGDAESNKP